MPLTKASLVQALFDQEIVSKAEAARAVDTVFYLIKQTLANGEDVLISGFGKFSVRRKNARRGRNPQTEESLILGARKVLVFKSSRVLRNRINESS